MVSLLQVIHTYPGDMAVILGESHPSTVSDVAVKTAVLRMMLLRTTLRAERNTLTSRSPGRWFVAQQLKILLAYITLNYEIRPLEGGRPSYRVMGDTMVPPRNTVIRVRRRQVTDSA